MLTVSSLRQPLGSCNCGRRDGCAQFRDAFDHVADRAECTERFVGDFDVKCLFDLEGDVDLVEGVDVELIEGAGQRDRAGRDTLRFGDDVDTAVSDVVHG
jgi:hypothetical protein